MNYSDYDKRTLVINKNKSIGVFNQTVFAIDYIDETKIEVYLNGVLQDEDTYVFSGNDTLTLNSEVQIGDILLTIEIEYR